MSINRLVYFVGAVLTLGAALAKIWVSLEGSSILIIIGLALCVGGVLNEVLGE